MSYRRLVWVPIAVALLFLLAELVMGPSPQALAIRVEVELAKILWLSGAIAAARVFESGDYLRRGWSLLAAGVAFFLLRDAVQMPLTLAILPPSSVGPIEGLLVVSGNVFQVSGVWVLAGVWRAVDLDDVVRGQGRMLFASAVAVVVVLLGPSLAHDAASALAGKLDAIPHLASDIGDAVSFLLLAALVRTALALRGGVVFWTWSLFAAGQLAWMLFDGARTLTELLGASSPSSPWVQSLRVAGALYLSVAGLAQRWIVSARFPVSVAAPVQILDDPS